MQEPTGKNGTRFECVGRFRFAVRDSMVVAGRSQSIYAVDVKTLPVPSGGFPELWKARLARIYPAALSGQSDNAAFRIFDLQPGTRAIWYFRDPESPHIHSLDVGMVAGPVAVFAARSGETGKESIVEDLVRIVLNAYVPSTSAGFCVGDGALTSKPGLDEEALLTLNHKKTKDLQIRFSTRMVSTPDTATYSDVEEEKELVEAGGGSISILKDHRRSVGNLEGKEIAISVNAPGEPPIVRFTWHFAGIARSSSKPMINIVGSAHLPDAAELQTIWNALLQSTESIPPSPQH